MMQQRVQQALQLQAMRDGFDERAPMLGVWYLPPAMAGLSLFTNNAYLSV